MFHVHDVHFSKLQSVHTQAHNQNNIYDPAVPSVSPLCADTLPDISFALSWVSPQFNIRKVSWVLGVSTSVPVADGLPNKMSDLLYTRIQTLKVINW